MPSWTPSKPYSQLAAVPGRSWGARLRPRWPNLRQRSANYPPGSSLGPPETRTNPKRSRASYSADDAGRWMPSPQSRIGSGLQRLTQSLFQLPAIRSADSRPRTVLQDHFKFAMGNRLQMQDAFDIDDRRAMDADKTNRI